MGQLGWVGGCLVLRQPHRDPPPPLLSKGLVRRRVIRSVRIGGWRLLAADRLWLMCSRWRLART